jgi:hypothetical protein
MAAAPRWLSRTTTQPMAARTDGHGKAGKRIRDLYRAYMTRIGNPDDPIAQSAALTAAELTFAAEACRAKVLADAGDAALADALVRVTNLADRAERKLAKFNATKKPPTLVEHLARRSAEKKAQHHDHNADHS